MVSEIRGFESEGVRLPPNFQRPVAASGESNPRCCRGARTCSRSSVLSGYFCISLSVRQAFER